MNDHWLIDGRNRLDALAELGILGLDEHGYLAYDISDNADTIWDSLIGYPVEGDPYAIAASYNLHRRHLNAEQKRNLIAKVLKANAEISDRTIGKQVKVDGKTVAAVRADLEERAEIPHVDKRDDSKGRKQPATKPGSGSPGFDAACEWAKRLGREVEQLKSGGYQLTSLDGAPPVCFHSLKRLKEKLTEIEEAEAGAKAAPTDDPQGEPTVEPGDVEDPALVLANVLDTIENQRSVAEAYRKIFKVSSFDRGAKKQISEAIDSLIRKWRSVQSTIPTPPEDTPPDPGPTPKPETGSKDTEEPAPAGTVSVEEQTAPIDRSLDIPDPLIQAARQRHPVASAPQDTSVPLTPLAPSPAPAPSPSPAPTPKLKCAPHYLPAHKDPWPANWRNLGADALEDVIHATQAFGVNHRLEDRHHRQLDKMRDLLAVLRKADRAERLPTSAEARP